MNMVFPSAMRQAFYYGLGLVMMKGVSLFMLPFFTRYLDTAEYGRLEVLAAFANVGTLILGFGLVEMLYRFSGAAENENMRNHLAAELFGLSLVIAAIALVVLNLFTPMLVVLLPADVAVIELRWLLVAIALEGGIAIPLAWLRMREQAKQFFLLTSFKVVIQAGLALWCLQLGWGVEGILFAGAVAAIVMVVILAWIHWRDVGIVFSTDNLRPMFAYGLPIVVSGIAAFALSGFDRWLLASELGEAAMAPFAVAAKFSMVAILLVQPFTLWWYPRRFRLLKEKRGLELNARYAVIGSALAVLVSGVVGAVSPWLIIWLTPGEYHEAVVYVPWLVAAVALKMISDLLNLGCFTGLHSRMQMNINLAVAAVGVVALFVFIPIYGIAGAVAALILSSVLRLLLFYFISQLQLELPYRLMPLYSAAGISTLLLVSAQVPL